MTLVYTIYWHTRCDFKSCQQETPQLLDATQSTDDAESKGWVTPDGLRWYCPTHVNSEEARS